MLLKDLFVSHLNFLHMLKNMASSICTRYGFNCNYVASKLIMFPTPDIIAHTKNYDFPANTRHLQSECDHWHCALCAEQSQRLRVSVSHTDTDSVTLSLSLTLCTADCCGTATALVFRLLHCLQSSEVQGNHAITVL